MRFEKKVKALKKECQINSYKIVRSRKNMPLTYLTHLKLLLVYYENVLACKTLFADTLNSATVTKPTSVICNNISKKQFIHHLVNSIT